MTIESETNLKTFKLLENSSVTQEQVKAVEAYNFFRSLKDYTASVRIEFKSYSDVPELTIYGESSLLKAKALLREAGLKVPKIEKHAYMSGGQYATGSDITNNIDIRITPTDTTFMGCKYVEELVPVEVKEHIVAAQPAREAIPEHVEPAHTEMQKKKVLKCGSEEE